MATRHHGLLLPVPGHAAHEGARGLKALLSLGIHGKELRFRFGKRCCGCSSVSENCLLCVTPGFAQVFFIKSDLFKAPENVHKLTDYFTHQTLHCYVLFQPQLYTLLTIFCSFPVTLGSFFPLLHSNLTLSHCKMFLLQTGVVLFYPGRTLAQ